MAYDDDAVVVGALFFRHVHFFVAAAFTGKWIETQPWTSFKFKWLESFKNIIDDAIEVTACSLTSQIREQMSGPDTQIFSPKKTGFSPIKNTFQNFFDFYLPLFYATFQCGP